MEVKNPMKNHIVFTEQVETLLFLFTGLLALGYWRASAVSYGWLFVLRPGWWVRYLISLLGVIPLILLDGAWTNLRTKMRPYNHDYGRYGVFTKGTRSCCFFKDLMVFLKPISARQSHREGREDIFFSVL